MTYEYKTRGVCSSKIIIDIDDEIINSVKFIGGCAGNSAGVASLCKGRNIDEIITSLKGIPCRGATSCPDQLAKALTDIKNK